MHAAQWQTGRSPSNSAVTCAGLPVRAMGWNGMEWNGVCGARWTTRSDLRNALGWLFPMEAVSVSALVWVMAWEWPGAAASSGDMAGWEWSAVS